MPKISKEEVARYEGVKWFLQKIEEKGFEEAKKEFEWRGVRNVPLLASETDLKKYEQRVKRDVLKTVLLMACYVAHDEFKIGATRMQRYIDRFTEYTHTLEMRLMDWQGVKEIIEEETGICLQIPDWTSDI